MHQYLHDEGIKIYTLMRKLNFVHLDRPVLGFLEERPMEVSNGKRLSLK